MAPTSHRCPSTHTQHGKVSGHRCWYRNSVGTGPKRTCLKPTLASQCCLVLVPLFDTAEVPLLNPCHPDKPSCPSEFTTPQAVTCLWLEELGEHWALAHLFEADPGIAVLSCPCAPVRHSRGASPQPLPPRQTIVPLGVHRSTKLPHAYGRTATASCWGTTDMSHHNNTSDTTLTICAADSRNISAPRIAG